MTLQQKELLRRSLADATFMSIEIKNVITTLDCKSEWTTQSENPVKSCATSTLKFLICQFVIDQKGKSNHKSSAVPAPRHKLNFGMSTHTWWPWVFVLHFLWQISRDERLADVKLRLIMQNRNAVSTTYWSSASGWCFSVCTVGGWGGWSRLLWSRCETRL